MLQSDVIRRLARECCFEINNFEHYQIIKQYIQMALAIGVEHYTKTMEEVIVMDLKGVERGRFKSIGEASRKLGINKSYIFDVLAGRKHSCGGYMFMKGKDYDLVKRPPTAEDLIL